MKMRTRWVPLGEFLDKCRVGGLALIVGLGFLAFGLMIGLTSRSTSNFTLRSEYEGRLSAWESQRKTVEVIRVVQHAMQSDSLSGVRPTQIGDDDYRYLRLVLALRRVTTYEQRARAYEQYMGSAQAVEDQPMRVMNALRNDALALPERLRLMGLAPDAGSTVYSVQVLVDDCLRRECRATEQSLRLDPRPRPPRYQTFSKQWWGGFALIIYLLVCLIGMCGYFFAEEENQLYWDVVFPENLAGWLVILLFAPAFAAGWTLTLLAVLLKHLVWRPGAWTFKGLYWLLFETSLVSAWDSGKKYLATKKAEREQSAREKQMERLVGDDVMALRRVLDSYERALANEPSANQSDLRAKIKGFRARLEKIANQRKKVDAEATPSAAQSSDVSLRERLNTLGERIDDLEEAENAAQ